MSRHFHVLFLLSTLPIVGQINANTVRDLGVRHLTRHLSSIEKGKWEATTKYPHFLGNTSLARFANQYLGHYARARFNTFVTETRSDWKSESQRFPYAFSMDTTTVWSTRKLISVRFNSYWFTGGAHPNREWVPMCFSYINGKPTKLRLKDLYRPKVDALNSISGLVVPSLKARNASWVMEPDFKHLERESGEHFTITPTAITYWFSPYEVGSYAEGEFKVKVPLTKLGDKLNSKLVFLRQK